jgi:hypothetical protein
MVMLAPTSATVVALAALYACGGASQGDGGDDPGGAPPSGGVAGDSGGAGASASGGVAGNSGSAPGGVAGAGGSPTSMCPAVLGMACEPDGISCLYDAWTQCLCTEPMLDGNGRAFDCKVVDTRCPSGPIAGSTHGPMANTPVACVCASGALSCNSP